MNGLIELKIKNVYRHKPSEDEGARARRIRAEQSLKNAYRKYSREAGKGNAEDVTEAAATVAVLSKKPLTIENISKLKLEAGRLGTACDRMLAVNKANDVAREMIRIKFATDASKPLSPSARGRKKAAQK
jgi:hypothetical protein